MKAFRLRESCNRDRTGSHGMTLVELTVTMLILALMGGSILWMLVTVKRIYQASIHRGGARQQIQLMIWGIQEDLKDSSFGTLTVTAPGTPPEAFSILSAYDVNHVFITDSKSAPVWQKCIVYYIPAGTTKLLRKEVFGAFVSALTSAQLLSYCDGQGKVLSDSVTSMSLVPDKVNRCAALSVTLQSKNNHGKTDIQSRQVTLLFNN
ncbi:MAG: type II secretion system protein J [Candidatus Xenobiia bacterium LiM19]